MSPRRDVFPDPVGTNQVDPDVRQQGPQQMTANERRRKHSAVKPTAEEALPVGYRSMAERKAAHGKKWLARERRSISSLSTQKVESSSIFQEF
jgi:hypothetical protein